jgi:GT2 family glycosyltransferase
MQLERTMRDNDLITVEVVFPVHNRRELTLQCLRSLARIDATGLEIHAVVVDDGSTDGTGDAIRSEFPDVEVVEGDGNLWFTEGTNVGIRRSLEREPKYILLINDDQVFDANCLKYMVETAERNPRSAVGSLLLLWDTPHKIFQVSPVWNTWLGGWRHWQSQTVWTVPERTWKVDIIVGNCVLVPTKAFREAGLMDSKRFPNFGDAEFTPRLRKLGWQLLIDPRARVFCQPNTPLHIRNISRKQMFSALFLDLKNGQNLRRRFYAALAGAPSKFQGIAAFFIFLMRAAIGKNYEKESWSRGKTEEPLSKTFADAVVDD